jgi:hypothetical protein
MATCVHPVGPNHQHDKKYRCCTTGSGRYLWHDDWPSTDRTSKLARTVDAWSTANSHHNFNLLTVGTWVVVEFRLGFDQRSRASRFRLWDEPWLRRRATSYCGLCGPYSIIGYVWLTPFDLQRTVIVVRVRCGNFKHGSDPYSQQLKLFLMAIRIQETAVGLVSLPIVVISTFYK